MQKILWINPLVFATVILFLATDCKKEDPESQTRPATNLSKTGATLNGTVDPNGLSTTVTFEYGATTSYDSSVTARQSPIPGNSITNVSADISGLTIGTTYHFRVKAENSHWTIYGSDMKFEYGYPPTVTTLAITNSKSTGVTLNGNVNAGGFPTIATFEYGTTTSYGQEVTPEQNIVTGNDITNVSADISGLTPCTAYHFRVKAENSFGTIYGSDITIYTDSIPTLTTTSISGITATTAISGGNITDEGCSPITDRGIDWWKPRTRPCAKCPSPIHYYTHDGTGAGSYTSNLTGLQPSTKYYVRSYAKNNAGIAYGNTVSFTTPSSGK